jgi:murein DD-endopeptidase MepM/ murein hydrolase activator NlpD
MGRSSAFRFTQRTLVVVAGLVLLVPVVLGIGGYLLGRSEAAPGPWALVSTWKKELASQRKEITAATQNASENIVALSRKLAELQAHVVRLDALGNRLTKMAKLDEGEFDFSQRPALGGPAESIYPDDSAHNLGQEADFMQSLNALSEQLENRSQQLSLLESMLLNRHLDQEVIPAGRPVTKGWTSSFFGMRSDPFTGHLEMHKGVDFAGKQGSDVVAVASGVVTWAGQRWGYGNLVEINHGNGYATRYGHNQEIAVQVGETVKKGQTIAQMGSTGRSTGPHVHFEVWRDGKAVDPLKYIRASQ